MDSALAHLVQQFTISVANQLHKEALYWSVDNSRNVGK